jgi:hypothetical protein
VLTFNDSQDNTTLLQTAKAADDFSASQSN